MTIRHGNLGGRHARWTGGTLARVAESIAAERQRTYHCPKHGVLTSSQVMNDGCDNAVCAVGKPGDLCFEVVRKSGTESGGES